MISKLDFIFCLVLIVRISLANNRIKLETKRVPEWQKINNFNAINHGPFFGQPEQVHLSYGGLHLV